MYLKKVGLKFIALLCSAVFFLFCSSETITRTATNDNMIMSGNVKTIAPQIGSNHIQIDRAKQKITLVTSVNTGSHSDERIRSIGWKVEIDSNTGKSAIALFEYAGDNADITRFGKTYSGYSFFYNYIIDEFSHDAGSDGAFVAKNFFYGTGSGGGGTIKMWAYFVWWRSTPGGVAAFNVNGQDGMPGEVSGCFAGDPVDAGENQPYNYTPSNVIFWHNTESRFSGLNIPNGVADNLAAAEIIPTMWGGNIDLSDYYPAIGGIPPSPDAANDLSIQFIDMGKFRHSTDVIQSVRVTNSGLADVTPVDNVAVNFSVPGVCAQSKQLVVPAQSSQLVYFKFTTPDTSDMTMEADVNANHAILETDYSNNTVIETVPLYNFAFNSPPNPGPKDRLSGFVPVAPPGHGDTQSLSWSQWVWNGGFENVTNNATLSTSASAVPDGHCPTAMKSGKWCMKSGYGVDDAVSTSIQSTDNNAVIGAQHVAAIYPEFYYSTYADTLIQTSAGKFTLPGNPYSLFGSPTHFTPPDYPDGDYTLDNYVLDAWTPAGMLSVDVTGTVNIKGSVFDDYYVKPGF